MLNACQWELAGQAQSVAFLLSKVLMKFKYFMTKRGFDFKKYFVSADLNPNLQQVGLLSCPQKALRPYGVFCFQGEDVFPIPGKFTHALIFCAVYHWQRFCVLEGQDL